jgi:hypothetical protein
MIVDNQPVSPPGSGPVPGQISQRTGQVIKTWMGRSDAVQLSRLGGVLNAFATDASSSLDRLGRLKAAVRDNSYSVTGTALGQTLILEMQGRR